MKLKDTFVTQEMDGEQVMVEADGGFAGMVRSNATAPPLSSTSSKRRPQKRPFWMPWRKNTMPPVL